MAIARWVRVDLHAHTPFDDTREWGKRARRGRDKGFETEKEQAWAWLDRCVEAGVDVVAITDHNRLDGYEAISDQYSDWSEARGEEVVVLPGVELSVAGCHFLVIADPSGRDWLHRLIGQAFGNREPIRSDGRPEEAEIGLVDLARRIGDAASSGRPVLALPAHVDKGKGLVKELSGLVRDRAFAQRSWSGFQVRRRDFTKSQDLLRHWASAFLFGRLPDELDGREPDQLAAYVARDAWPLVDASDPSGLSELAAVFTWMKMGSLGVEGIRQALLDPQSRLRAHEEGPPTEPGTWIEEIELSGLEVDGSLFDEGTIRVVLSPGLNTIIGGRGTGKSTLVELLRWGLDRDRATDFASGDEHMLDHVVQRLSRRSGDTGILGDETTVRIVMRCDGRSIETVRSLANIATAPRDGVGSLDIRRVIEPRIISQRQIGEIARDPKAIRREIDHAVSDDALEKWRNRHAALTRDIERLQGMRRDLIVKLDERSAVETDIEMLGAKIGAIEEVAESDALDAHRTIEEQSRWLSDIREDIEQTLDQLPQEPLLPELWPATPAIGPASDVLEELLEKVAALRARMESQRRLMVETATSMRTLIVEMQDTDFKSVRAPIASEYERLIGHLRDQGVELGELAGLHKRRAALKKELSAIKRLPSELKKVQGDLTNALSDLEELHRERSALRGSVAQRLAERDADIRVTVQPFGDRDSLAAQRDRWWGGTGMRSDDWGSLVDWVYETESPRSASAPRRWRELVEALRTDQQALLGLNGNANALNALLGTTASGFVEKALRKVEAERFDEMARFLPEDEIIAQFRDRDGEFRPITRGSLGQQNTAVLSLLLTVGVDPLVLDQPEDDLDNRYIYDVVVELLRSTKHQRQIIAATHNANVPVNGDAECIVALDPALNQSIPVLVGSLDQVDVKVAVSNIMEGSEAAFRLRRERYGY